LIGANTLPVDRYVCTWSVVCGVDAVICNNHGVVESCIGQNLAKTTTQANAVGIHYPSRWVCILDSTDVSQIISTKERIALPKKCIIRYYEQPSGII